MSTQTIHRFVSPASLLLAAVVVSAGFGAPVRAESAPPDAGAFVGALPDRLLESGAACGQALAGSRDAGMNCVSSELGGFLVGAVARLAEAQGRAVFGPRFQLVHRLSWSPFGEGLSGHLDAVVPLAFLSGAEAKGAGRETRAVFLQQGVTRWRDKDGFRRNDARVGAAYRFSLSDEPGGDVIGVQAALQENVERGHRRVVAGLDYAGRWGAGSLQQFVPVTGWRPGRWGHMERPRGGTRLGLRLDATTTLALETSVSRWRGDGAGRAVTDGRVALGWRPHPWLRFEAGLAGIGASQRTGALRMAVAIPLGGGADRAPRWEGLGLAGGSPATADLWRPMEGIERLETVERKMTAEELAAANGITARFLQDSAASGDAIGVEVAISAPMRSDLRVEIRLRPGGGADPAVAGEDFVDEPVSVTIPQGATTARVSIRLLRNAGMQSGRSLSVEVGLPA